MEPIHIRCYTRRGCCLCDRALATLRELESEFRLQVETTDISDSPDLLSRYGTQIPVATMGDQEIFRYHADKDRLRALFASLVGSAGATGEVQTL